MDAPEQPDARRHERNVFARGATGTLAIQVVRVAAVFGLNVLLARLLGKIAFGRFSYATSIVTILSVLACLGMDGVLLRFVAAYRATADWAKLRGVIRWGVWVAVAAAAGVGLIGSGVVVLLGDRIAPDLRAALLVALSALLPAVALITVLQASLRSLGRPALASLPRFIIRPGLLAAAVVAWVIIHPVEIDAAVALGLDAGAMLLAAALLYLSLRGRLDPSVRQSRPLYAIGEWTGVGLMLMITAALHTINSQTDLLMLGVLRGMGDAGAYKAAVQISLLVMLGNVAANAIAASMIASAHASEDSVAMRRAASRAALAATAFAVPVAAGLGVAGGWLLGVFGEGFAVAWAALGVLLAGYVLNTIAGPAGLLLTMTGRQKQAAVAVGIGVLANIILNAALIPAMGLLGAATATAVSMTIGQVCMVVAVRRRMGLWPTALHALRRVGRA
ncbi:MAG: oligosaccharide flippase family protein [Planctomycetes bacterium]|nr:polysaccharide biosynthesis C-terminal domain-containing protein [Phycisphaerae bacterium]NBB95557.1 oligosaccharide flippase family protein [Planctomycetota bacterium]